MEKELTNFRDELKAITQTKTTFISQMKARHELELARIENEKPPVDQSQAYTVEPNDSDESDEDVNENSEAKTEEEAKDEEAKQRKKAEDEVKVAVKGLVELAAEEEAKEEGERKEKEKRTESMNLEVVSDLVEDLQEPSSSLLPPSPATPPSPLSNASSLPSSRSVSECDADDDHTLGLQAKLDAEAEEQTKIDDGKTTVDEEVEEEDKVDEGEADVEGKVEEEKAKGRILIKQEINDADREAKFLLSVNKDPRDRQDLVGVCSEMMNIKAANEAEQVRQQDAEIPSDDDLASNTQLDLLERSDQVKEKILKKSKPFGSSKKSMPPLPAASPAPAPPHEPASEPASAPVLLPMPPGEPAPESTPVSEPKPTPSSEPKPTPSSEPASDFATALAPPSVPVLVSMPPHEPKPKNKLTPASELAPALAIAPAPAPKTNLSLEDMSLEELVNNLIPTTSDAAHDDSQKENTSPNAEPTSAKTSMSVNPFLPLVASKSIHRFDSLYYHTMQKELLKDDLGDIGPDRKNAHWIINRFCKYCAKLSNTKKDETNCVSVNLHLKGGSCPFLKHNFPVSGQASETCKHCTKKFVMTEKNINLRLLKHYHDMHENVEVIDCFSKKLIPFSSVGSNLIEEAKNLFQEGVLCSCGCDTSYHDAKSLICHMVNDQKKGTKHISSLDSQHFVGTIDAKHAVDVVGMQLLILELNIAKWACILKR